MGKAKIIARRLLKQNRGTASITARSWRVIARDDYENKIPAGTLCTFAKRDGEWLPKYEYQITLSLKHERKTKTGQPPEPLSEPRIISTLRKLGWLDETRVTQ